MILWALWYTFDDWLARVLHIPWLGDVPLILAIVAEIVFWSLLAVPSAILGRSKT